MMEEKVSHIEILQEERETKQVEQKKSALLEKLTDIKGWKNDVKKIVYLLGIALVLVVGYVGISNAVASSWKLRFHMPVEVIQYEKHSQDNPTFSFLFSKKFVYDDDQQKKYGADYLGGFHLQADQRTGCDVRLSTVGINFAKNDQEINDAISKDLSSHVKGFANYSAKRIKMDGQDAMVTEFTLTDPLSNTLHLKQVMVSKGGDSYLLVCGSGQSQYDFYKDDFSEFIGSFRFTR